MKISSYPCELPAVYRPRGLSDIGPYESFSSGDSGAQKTN
jgi:hypothetical protein